MSLLMVGLFFIIVLKSNKSPRWKYIFILLLIVDLLPFAWLPFIASASAGGVLGSVLLPLAYFLTIVNIMVTLIYLGKQHPQGWAKIICYIFLIYLVYTLLKDISIVLAMFNYK
jgi:hypothetical protein